MGNIVLPTRAIAWDTVVRADYVSGKIDVEQLEEELELIFSGGVPQRLLLGLSPFEAPTLERVVR